MTNMGTAKPYTMHGCMLNQQKKCQIVTKNLFFLLIHFFFLISDFFKFKIHRRRKFGTRAASRPVTFKNIPI